MKNPKEYFCLRQNQTFFALNELTIPVCKDGSEPLTFHHNTFSRFKFVIINAEKKAATANIPVTAIPGIFEKMKEARLQKKEDKNDAPANSQAYTVVITSGTLRGKTPAQALIENPNNRQFLINQVSFLKQHLAQYPKNQVQIDALEDALKLYDSGKLDKTAEVSGPSIIYQTGVRPLIRRKDVNGRCFVYEISISYNDAAEKPVSIEIRNYFAPVEQKENGLLNVKARERVDEIKNAFNLSIDEWLWFEHMTEAQIRTFENINAPSLYKTANEQEKLNRNNAGF